MTKLSTRHAHHLPTVRALHDLSITHSIGAKPLSRAALLEARACSASSILIYAWAGSMSSAAYGRGAERVCDRLGKDILDKAVLGNISDTRENQFSLLVRVDAAACLGNVSLKSVGVVNVPELFKLWLVGVLALEGASFREVDLLIDNFLDFAVMLGTNSLKLELVLFPISFFFEGGDLLVVSFDKITGIHDLNGLAEVRCKTFVSPFVLFDALVEVLKIPVK